MGSWYQSHVNSCGEWDSMQASKEAIPHFLAEMKRKTGSFNLDDLPKLNPEVRKFSNLFGLKKKKCKDFCPERGQIS